MHCVLLRYTLILAVVSIVSAFWTENVNSTTKPQQWSSHFQQRQAGGGTCGTEEPSPALRDAHKRLSSTEYRQVVVGDGENASSIRPPVDSLPRIQVDTWFHVVSTSDQADLVTNAMIADQFVYLQQAYANTSIHYNLRGVDRSINDTWARNGDALAMKRTLRRGSYSALNIYFQTNLEVSDPTTSVNSRRSHNHDDTVNNNEFPRDQQQAHYSSSSSSTPNLLGFCTLPNPQINTSSSTPDAYISDGCTILAATMPGGSITHYNRGGTTVHEVGHWHGLLHTFQDETCTPGDNGDYIADTPQQSAPTEGCPAAGTKDSCPDLPGLDAVANFMDYSSDDCYQGFTYDQAMRMRSMWSTMREGK